MQAPDILFIDVGQGQLGAALEALDEVGCTEQRVVAIANGHELLATVTGTGCMSTAITGCFLTVRPDDPLEAAAEALVAFGVAGEEAAKNAKKPGSFHVALYDALYDLDPKKLDSRAKVE